MSESGTNVRAANVCLIGSFPPTASGQASINDAFRRTIVAAGASVTTIDISPSSAPASLRRRLSRVPKVVLRMLDLGLLLARRAADGVYLGAAGGYGQLYDVVFASMVRLSGVRLFVHHDSYAYLDKPRLLTRVLLHVAGPLATHIVGCDDMKDRLITTYGHALQVVVVSNSTNIEHPIGEPRARTKLMTIGFISHLSRSKGVLEFLDVAERVCLTHPELHTLLAGAILDAELEPAINKRVLDASWITYLGPVYGDKKERFYADIDAFVFPTRHLDEADPRVVSEAQAHGVPVITRARGCIPSIVSGGGGAAIPEGADFAGLAEGLLNLWCSNPSLFESVSRAALANSRTMKTANEARFSELIRDLSAHRRAAQ